MPSCGITHPLICMGLVIISMKTIATCILISAMLLVLSSVGAAPADGTIDEGEYEESVSLGGGAMVIHWTVDGEVLHMALDGATDGWIAIGFEPTVAMRDADMVIGWYDNGEVV